MKRKLRIISAAAALVAAASLLASTQAQAKDIETARATATVVPGPNTVGTTQLINNGITSADYGLKSIWGGHIHDNTIGWPALGSQIRGEIRAAQSLAATANKTANEAKIAANGATTKANAADQKAQQALDAVNNLPQSPAYLDGWGTIFRNVIGNGTAELGQSSAGAGLAINTPAGTDMASFGNEKDYAGKPFTLTSVGYEVFTTGENIAKSATGNMPAIKIEITNPAASQSYTTLVYAPGNSAANTWTAIDAKADTEKHWGFTGAWFNGAADRCGLNGARCTLAEALAVLDAAGGDAKFMSVAVGKGRDFEFHGAVRKLTINGDTFVFGKDGVTKS